VEEQPEDEKYGRENEQRMDHLNVTSNRANVIDRLSAYHQLAMARTAMPVAVNRLAGAAGACLRRGGVQGVA
jgi:hypothetical protein